MLEEGPTSRSAVKRAAQKAASATNKPATAAAVTPAELVDWTGVPLRRIEYESATTIFAQGDPATSVMYVDSGAIRLSVLSHAGKEAVIAVLEAGHVSARAVWRASRAEWPPRRR